MGLQIICFILQIVFILYIINKNERPSLKLGWLLLILLFPAFGVILYLWGGEGRPTKKMRKRIEKSKEELKSPLNEYRGHNAISLEKVQDSANSSPIVWIAVGGGAAVAAVAVAVVLLKKKK